MKKVNVYINYLYNLSYQLLVIILPLITTPYVSRVLGASGIGAYSYTQSITQYFILFGCIGLNLYGQKQIAFVQDDLDQRSKLFFELVLVRIFTISLSLLIFFFTCVQNEKYHLLFLIQIIDIIASIFDISWFFQGIEDFKKIVLRNFVVKIIGVILIFTVVKEPSDLPLYVLCYSATLLLGNLSMWFYMPKLVNKVRIKTLNCLQHIKPTIVMFIPQIATSIYTMLDKTMIGALTGIDAEVGYYEQSQKIIKMSMTLVTSLGTVMLPRIANMFANKDFKQIEKYMINSFRFVFALGLPIMFGIIGISKGLIPWFYGEGFDKVLPNMIIISPIILVIGLSTITGTQYLLPTNRQTEFTVSVILGAIVNFILNIVLIPILLSIGAAIATVIAEISVTAYQMYVVRHEFNLKRIFKISLKYLIASIAMLIVLVLLNMQLSATLLNTVIEIGIGGLVYLIVLIILKDEIVKETIRKLYTKKNKAQMK